jgi:VIT1/CCC1 family predicted Fe2+/Mn2+ transporter
MATPTDARRLRTNLQGEVDSASLYETLSRSEPDPGLAQVYARLAAVERRHADFWRRRLNDSRPGTGSPRPSLRARTLAWLARRFGASFVLPTVAAGEARDIDQYDQQADALAAGLPADERSHARIVQALEASSGGLTGSAIARLEGRHRGMAGNALRAAVLGANDGLVSNLSLVMGVAGASSNGHTILLTGLAGLVAGSCSMAMGEWLSVNSSRELYQKQIATEAQELEHSPAEEREELVLIYQAKGLPEDDAKRLADRLLGDKNTALDTLSREELGIDPEELGGSPWQAAGASFLLFACGAIFPVAPFLFLSGTRAMLAALGLAGLALAGIGAATTLFTGRGVVFSASRQLAIGYAAAAVTYGVGHLVGVSLS